MLKERDDLGGRGVILQVPSATLELVEREPGALMDEVRVCRSVDDRVRVAVNIDELGRESRQVEASGAVPVADPVDTPWGGHNQRFSAADGLQLTLFQSPS